MYLIIKFLKNSFKFFCVITLLSFANPLFAKVEKINYRGWKNCYQISNSISKLIIVPESGGRLLAFTHKGKNILFEDSNQNGKSFKQWLDQHFDPDGGRLDYGPEKETDKLHHKTWMGVWKVKFIGQNSIIIYSENDCMLGLYSERQYTLHKSLAQISIFQSATNVSNKILTRHFWSRTLVHPGGEVVIKLNSKSRFKNGWGQFLFDPDRIEENRADSRLTIKNNFINFKSLGNTFKFGTDTDTGLIDYYYNGLKFQKRYLVGSLTNYTASNNMSVIFYHCPSFFEIEPTSETIRLKPGEKMFFTEEWNLTEKK